MTTRTFSVKELEGFLKAGGKCKVHKVSPLVASCEYDESFEYPYRYILNLHTNPLKPNISCNMSGIWEYANSEYEWDIIKEPDDPWSTILASIYPIRHNILSELTNTEVKHKY